jgi:serine phosphatase RsbU (regulator of sigma subunit)
MKFDEDSFFQTSVKNIKDKTLLIYTDGVTEGYLKNNEELGVQGFENLIKDNKFDNSKHIIDKVCEVLNNRSKLRDDITCIGINI